MTAHELLLPGVLAEIDEVAGRVAAVDLSIAMGGLTLHVPQPGHMNHGHLLVEAVGREAALLIAERFQGESLYIPIARRFQALALAERGLSKKEIAQRLRISKRSIERYIRATPVA